MTLEELRTKEEILIYFKKLGKEITEEEIEALKQSYNQAKQNNRDLTLQQLDNVVGGIDYWIGPPANPAMEIETAFSPRVKKGNMIVSSDSRFGGTITDQRFKDIYIFAYTYGKAMLENGIVNARERAKAGYPFSIEEKSLLKQLGEIINGPTFEQDARRYRLEVARSNPAYHDFGEIFDKFPGAEKTLHEEIFSRKYLAVKSVLDMASTLVRFISFKECESTAKPFEIYPDNFIVFNSYLGTLAPEKCLNIFAYVINNTFGISDKLPLEDRLTDMHIRNIFRDNSTLFEIDGGNEHSKIIFESASDICVLLEKLHKEDVIADRKELFTKIFDIYVNTNGTWKAEDSVGSPCDFKDYFPKLIDYFENSIRTAQDLYNSIPVPEKPKRSFPVIEDVD